MNLNKILASALLLAGVVASNAADHVVYLTGATAFRSQVHAALTGLGLGAAAGNNNTQSTFSGTVGAGFGSLSGKTVEAYCSWSGSAAGVAALTVGTNVAFRSTAGTASAVNAPADYALSDAFQSSTLFTSPVLAGAEMVPGKVGIAVVPFTWAANANAVAGGITNVTPKITDQLFANGVWLKSFWTGNSADSGITVNVTGRDASSGTRIVTLAETGYGIFSSVTQRRVTSNVWEDHPAGGHSGGASVAADLANTLTGEPAIGYMGLGDGITLAGGAQPISWNGVTLWNGSAFNLDKVKNGAYTYWGYEHLYRKPGINGALVSTFEPAFLTSLNTQLGLAPINTTAVKIADMNVSRNIDGGPVAP